MSTRHPRQGQGGLSLVELIMFMVIVSIAVMGVLQVMNLTVRSSVDPLMRKQALLIAEALLEEVELAHFTYCDASDAQVEAATSPAGCTIAENVGPDAGETRPFDNVNDYVSQFGVAQAAFNNGAGAVSDLNLTALNVAGYQATLSIVPQALSDIASSASPAGMDVLRITVTVSYGSDSVVLDGYRTRYAPRSI